MGKPLRPVVHVDAEKCANCHACIMACPVKLCNDGSGGYVTLNPDMCVGCGNCIRACPHGARSIVDDWDGFAAALEAKTPLVAIVAPGVAASFPDHYFHLNGWLRAQGVAAVFDVSVGAELAVLSHLHHARDGAAGTLISSACPALATFIEIYHPELLHRLAPIDTPMVHTMKMIRRFFPHYRDHRIVALSPCTAKRREFDAAGLGDFNVTLARLNDHLRLSGVRLEDYPATPFDGLAAGVGAGFSSPGGMLRAIESRLGRPASNVRQIEGSPNVYEYLAGLAQQVQNGVAPALVDCLSCPLGCNGGSGTQRQHGHPDELEWPVSKRVERSCQPTPVPAARVEDFWDPDLYRRTFLDLSANNVAREPSPAELQAAFIRMLKTDDSHVLNCSSCGYGSCHQMAKAICNGLSKPENCNHYRVLALGRTARRSEEAEREIRRHRDHLDLIVHERTRELTELNSHLQEEVRHRVEAEKLLRDSEHTLANIINFLPDATLAIDTHGVVIAWNRAMERLTGVPAEQMIGKGDHEYALPLYGHRRPMLIDMVLHPELLPEGRYYGVRSEGDILYAEAKVGEGPGARHLWGQATVLRDSDGNVVGAIETLRDTTLRKKAETELEHARDEAQAANVAKSEFLANMSHEMRTPLTAILGYADLLRDGDEPPAKQHDYMDEIHRNGHHLLTLINDVLDLSKIEAGRFTVEARAVDVGGIIREVASMLQGSARKRGLTLMVQTVDCPQVVADANRLRQVLLNLVGNAVKFTESGSVCLRCALEPTWRNGRIGVRVDVVDTGLGMTSDLIKRIGEPFVQADASTTRRYGGTGLGLAISLRLVKLMGGEVRIESEVGRGSCFSVLLPAAVTDPAESPARPESAPAVVADDGESPLPEISGLRVLLAEDSPVNQRLVMRLLQKSGAAVTLADNGREAVELALQEPFDVILMDMQMPEMDGYEATSHLRHQGYAGPIVALTAHAMMGDREKCLVIGCSDYLTKPIDRRAMIQTIHRLVHPAGQTQPPACPN